VLSYEVDGPILTLRASGTATLEERQPVLDAVRADTGVPHGALVLLDFRLVDPGISEAIVPERLPVLLDQLGPKLGPVCAMVVTPGLAEPSRLFQLPGIGVGVRVALFNDELSAREWLSSYQ
jgi:hypothetical protein